MEMEIEFNNVSKNSLKVSFLRSVAKRTLKKAGVDFLADKNVGISFADVSQEEIKKLNRTYRRKNTPTDVLSFSEYKNIKEIEKERNKDVFLGEIILCSSDMEKYCRSEKIVFQEELAKVISHGVLHLLGMRHGKKMFLIQDEVAKEVCREK